MEVIKHTNKVHPGNAFHGCAQNKQKWGRLTGDSAVPQNLAKRDPENICDSAHPFTAHAVHSCVCIQCVSTEGRRDSATHRRARACTHSWVRSHTREPRLCHSSYRRFKNRQNLFMATDVIKEVSLGRRYEGTFWSDENILYFELGGVYTLKIHQTKCLRFVHFTVYEMYLNKLTLLSSLTRNH